MLHVTIKDTKTNEVVYDNQVTMSIMQAAEKDRVIALSRISNDASLNDIFSCLKVLNEATDNANEMLSGALKIMVGSQFFDKSKYDDFD